MCVAKLKFIIQRSRAPPQGPGWQEKDDMGELQHNMGL